MAKKYERFAMQLLREYEGELIAGRNPKPEDYLARYPDPNKTAFIAELNIVTLLTVDGIQARKKASEILEEAKRTRWLGASKEGLLRKLRCKK